MIDVVIPVGPYESNRRWLKDALDSIHAQTMPAAHIVLIDDSPPLPELNLEELGIKNPGEDILIIKNPWRSGVTHSFNFGVAQAKSHCALMMGSDDLLEPECIEACWDTYNAHGRLAAYYWLDVKYMSTGNVQSIACNAAMVPKRFWAYTGGLPIEAACGAGDAALLSICIAHNLPMVRVNSDPEKPLYLYRDHAETDTVLRAGSWHDVIIDIRNKVTKEWQPFV